MKDKILEKLERDKISINRDIARVIDDVEYSEYDKMEYLKYEGAKTYILNLIDYINNLESKGE